VSGNSASTTGGGISAFTEAILTRSTVSGNTAQGSGGGIAANTATLTNSTVSGNTAGGNGGGLWATAAELLNCTVVENIASTGGGLHHEPGGTFSLRNTIVALNLVGFGVTGADVSGVFTSEGHNLIGDGSGSSGLTHGSNGNIVGDGVNPIDPKIGALKNNGGPTKTHALLAGSKAIDRGDNSLLPLTDQRGAGFPRVKDGNGDGSAVVDIGAFER
jgi:predicted outer membrane repeat protein